MDEYKCLSNKRTYQQYTIKSPCISSILTTNKMQSLYIQHTYPQIYCSLSTNMLQSVHKHVVVYSIVVSTVKHAAVSLYITVHKNIYIYSRDQGLVHAPRPNAGRAKILVEIAFKSTLCSIHVHMHDKVHPYPAFMSRNMINSISILHSYPQTR